MMLTAILILLAVLLSTASWGPAVHVWAAREIVKRVGRRHAGGQNERLILDHTEPFLYGSIAADMISFKAFGGFRNSCHNWNMAERMQPYLTSPDKRAFALGYLCHLAADVSSHNHFVPFHRVAELPPRLFGHTYWEGKADHLVGDRCLRMVDELRRSEEFHAFDAIIDDAVAVKALSLRSNRLIFHTLVLAHSRPVWRTARTLLAGRPPRLSVNEELFELLRQDVLRDMCRIVEGRDLPALTSQDPTGRIALRAARALRRQLILHHGSREAALPVARRLARECFWPARP